MANSNGPKPTDNGGKARKTGRRTRLTETVQAQIVRDIRVGAMHWEAFTNAGISETSFYAWRARGEDALEMAEGRIENVDADNRIFAAFAEALKKSEAEAKLHALAMVRAAMGQNWQAAAWFLERRYPDEYGRRERRDVTLTTATATTGELDPDDHDAIEQFIEAARDVLTDEELHALIAEETD